MKKKKLKLGYDIHGFNDITATECVTETFFESILTTFEVSLIFRGSRGSIGNQLKPRKFEPQPS